MKFSNIFEKIQILFNMIVNSNMLIILSILVIMLILLRLTNKINNKKLMVFTSLVEIIMFVVIIFNNQVLIDIYDNLVDYIFLNFYFPSIYIYLFIFISSYIIFILNILNKYISNTYKKITNIYFVIFNFLFVTLVCIIGENDIDIFTKTGLYTNNNVLVLLELSTLLFFTYLVLNALVYITNYLIVAISLKKTIKVKDNNVIPNELKIDVEEEYLVPELAYDNEVKVSPKIDLVPEVSNMSYETYDNKMVDLVPEVSNMNINNNLSIDFVPKVNNEVNSHKFFGLDSFTEPFTNMQVEDNLLKEKMNFIDFGLFEKKEEDNITLNDYKIFSNMLKTIIDTNGNNLSVDDILNKVLLNKSFAEYNKFEKILNSCLN